MFYWNILLTSEHVTMEGISSWEEYHIGECEIQQDISYRSICLTERSRDEKLKYPATEH